MKRQLLALGIALALAPTCKAQVDIKIDSRATGVEISPMLYGIFYEDINHAADGGIYAELIRNRSFEDDESKAAFWEPYLSVSGNVKMSIAKEGLLNDAQKQCLHVVTTGIGDTDAGVSNNGFWGINAVKGRTYRLSMWVKANRVRELYAMIKGKTGTKLYASERLKISTAKRGWQHVTATLTSTTNDKDAIFVVSSKGNSDFYLDVVSLFPPTYKNRENGLRPDLVEMLHDLHPSFMRFPGGCFVEGQDSPDNAFRWERTIGSIEERPGHWNKNWGYRTSDGLGFHEYLQLAEDIGAKPLYVCNIGIWHGGVTPVEDVRMWVDECMNALEYANGPKTSKYGAMRARNGHPEPFNIEYIEIGNENNQTDGQQTSDHYYERYRIFRTAILKKYPKMHIIGNVAAWGTDEPRWQSKEKVALVDEHYYRSPAWFANNFKKYDAYSRSQPNVYCGEYAVTQGFGELGNLNAALGEAVFMMGMENNSDIVKMSSYAPIFVNENDDRWRPDMVRFNASAVMGTPSYYVQKLMADNRGTRTLKVTEGDQVLGKGNQSFTPDESYVGVGTWNTQSVFADIAITAGTHTIFASGKKVEDFTLRATTWETRSNGLAQTGEGKPVTALVSTPIGGRHYSVSMRAKKNSGDEGFLIIFNYEDKDNYCWFNVGGWDNTSTGFEQAAGGGKTTLKSVKHKIETGRWYDIRVEIDGNKVAGYVDDELIVETELRGITMPGLFTTASMDDNSGEMIVKIVNTSSEPETANLSLGDFNADGAELIQMKSVRGTAENTLDNPTTVYPTSKHISLEGTAPQFYVPPFSLNILRIKEKK
jgi:alpha-L-arabinofuranosidase